MDSLQIDVKLITSEFTENCCEM